MNIIFAFFSKMIPEIADKGGMIEIITNTMYILMFVAFIIFINDFIKTKKLTYYFMFLFLGTIAFFREIGAQHWLASKDTTAFKSRFFLNPNNPISEKIIAGAILLIIFAVIIFLLIKYSKYLIISFFKMKNIGWSFATLAIMLVIGRFLDRLPSNYRKKYNVLMDLEIRNNLFILEETSEVFLPFIVIILLLQNHLFRKEKTLNFQLNSR